MTTNMIPKGFPKKMSRSHNPYKSYSNRFRYRRGFFTNKNKRPNLSDNEFNQLHDQEKRNVSVFLTNTEYNTNRMTSIYEKEEEAYEVATLLKKAYDSRDQYKQKYGNTIGIEIELEKMTKENKNTRNKRNTIKSRPKPSRTTKSIYI